MFLPPLFESAPPVPVGGHIVPVNKLGLAALASFAALTVALVRRHKA